MRIDTSLLVVGRGPAAVVVAKVAAREGVPCLLAGHEVTGGDEPVALGADAIAALEAHGVLDVLRPYLVASDDGPAIAPRDFEDVVKHHCVADLNVTVYDEVEVVDIEAAGAGVHGVLTDGRSRWDLDAERMVDAGQLPGTLPAAITAGVEAALMAIGRDR
jgi:hypothetical protein